MELRSLEYFLAACADLNVSRAAVRCNVTQPTLSRKIKELEEELGVELFLRKPTGLLATEAGMAFAEYARDIVAHAKDAQTQVEEKRKAPKMTMALSCDTTSFPVDALRSFSASTPQARVTIYDQSAQDQLTALREGRIDLAIVDYDPSLAKEFETGIVSHIPMILLISDRHRLARAPSRNLADYAEDPFIGFSEKQFPGRNERTRAACALVGFNPQFITAEADSHLSLSGLIAAGQGIALVPATAERKPHPALVVVRLNEPMVFVDHAAVWRKEAVSQLLADFLQVLLKDPVRHTPTF